MLERKPDLEILQYRRQRLILALFVGLLLLLGLLLASDYGMSWDEFANVQYGQWAFDQFRSPTVFKEADSSEFNQPPFYYIIFSIAGDFFARLPIGWLPADGRHFMNFLMFLAACLALYSILARIVKFPFALFGGALMASQPLLFGHAFINQKDIPFMALVTVSLALGLKSVEMVAQDSAERAQPSNPPKETGRAKPRPIRRDWQDLSGREKGSFTLFIVVMVVLGLWIAADWGMSRWSSRLLQEAYSGTGSPLIVKLFNAYTIAGSASPLAAYQAKLDTLLRWIEILSTGLILLAVFGVVCWKFQRLCQPIRQARRSILLILLSGAVLGLATATREVAPFFGVLISLLLLLRTPRRWYYIVLYGLVAWFFMYISWPSLWGEALSHFLSRASEVTGFQQPHSVFYRGQVYSSLSLPWHYLPWLTVIQLTVPLLIGVLVGVYDLGLRLKNSDHNSLTLLLVLLWWIVPTLLVIVLNSALYGNIRHMFFTLPPLVIFSAMGWQRVLKATELPRWLLNVLLTLLLLPGIVSIVRNHPYQYIYYNELVGGVNGADGSYELDHWCTSFRQAADFMNENLPERSTVAVWGPVEAASTFTREDLDLVPAEKSADPRQHVLFCRNGENMQFDVPGYQLVGAVELRGSSLSEIYTLSYKDG